ncbi:hypothetical protein A6E15_10335 [Natrinema saccharevitans]|uniref:Uncharacterized protein n=1 Tax=Natrinema saccharevitans TaxID=301967 RepID=A0A1S8AXT8_9EURY|nr:hypothetical protein [Natrinema saccharevitans]OLZ41361.1 hypothetical protein A6E15_10335 [Natrinema saccharevitans]
MIPRRDLRETGTSDADRAVSDMIAFVLVFAIIIGSVGLLSTVGFQAMTDYQEGEQLRNAERAMVSLADNFNDVLRYDGVEQRDGELSLRGGTVAIGGGGTTVNVTADGNDDPLGDTDLGTFTYEHDSTRIAYEGGGVIRSTDSGSVVAKRPQLRCNTDGSGPDTAIVSFVTVDAAERAIQSDGGQEFTISKDGSPVRRVEEYSDATVTVHVDTDYERAWASNPTYGDWDVEERNNPVELRCQDVDRLVITVVPVDINY